MGNYHDLIRITIAVALFASSLLARVESRLTRETLAEAYATKKEEVEGTKWAVLVAGSNGYMNYRHQADVCHAYQILKAGGLKDENIVVLMYDDIAKSRENPRPGTIINKPNGTDVYKGVPKDYTGKAVTAENLLAVILGEKKSVKGGSGKVVNSGPNDQIFIYYADHGSPGLLSMPSGRDLFANDFVDTLKKKRASGTYKSMVIYVEACEAGSIFDGLLPKGMDIYVTTASNPSESSYATYCPGSDDNGGSDEFNTCLGDLYSVAWLEDADQPNGGTETLQQQYEVVKKRTLAAGDEGSHVMQYGDTKLATQVVSLYIGTSKASTRKHHHGGSSAEEESAAKSTEESPPLFVEQREADILYLRHKFRSAPTGSIQKVEAKKALDDEISHRNHVDATIEALGQSLFGANTGADVLNAVRPAGNSLVHDWDCLKSMVDTYQTHCGPLSTYGSKYMRAFANICNAGVRKDQVAQAAAKACS